MFTSQSDIGASDYAAQVEKREQRQAQAKGGGGGSGGGGGGRRPTTPSSARSSSPSSTSSSKDKADHSRPLLTSQHSTYDTNAEEAARRTVQIKRGEFQWNEDDRQTLRERHSQSFGHRLFSRFPCGRTSLTRAHLYGSNALRSTRYTLLTFLPVNLFEQLAPWIKPANFYFLCIAVLQAFPSISTTQGRPSILLPLLIVIIISAVKDALEDYGRWKGDWQKNNEQYKTYHRGHFHLAHSKDLLVGDIIMIEDGQRVPADCILLVSGVGGGSLVYVDTKNLDGETNLKPKAVPLSLLRGFREDWKGVGGMDVKVTVDAPNGDMRSFSGEIRVDGEGSRARPKTPRSARGDKGEAKAGKGDDSSEALTLDHFILSDCLVRNTPWLIGLIIYAGEDTKIRQNMKAQLTESRRKETRVFAMTKRIFLLMVLVQVVMCALAAVLAGWYESTDIGSAWYLYTDSLDAPLLYAGQRFLTWFIIVKDFVPISLYVSLELVQFLQALFMQWDATMRVSLYGTELGTRVNSSNLNEELAQVHFVFSDKTGTLTDNSMVYKKCVIGTERYGRGVTEAGLIRQAKDAGKDVKKAISEFTEAKRKEREEEEERAKKGEARDEREKHCEFDEIDELRELLKKSKRAIGQGKEEPKKSDEEKGDGAEGRGGKAGSAPNGKERGNVRKGDAGKEKAKDEGRSSKRSEESAAAPQKDGGGGKGDEDGGAEEREEPKAPVKKVTIAEDAAASSGDSDSGADATPTPKAAADDSASTPKAADGSASDEPSKASESPSSADGAKGPKPGPKPKRGAPSPSKPAKAQGSPKGGKRQQQAQAQAEGHSKDDEEQAALVREFLYCLALNNSVFPKVRDDEEVGGDTAEDEDDSEDADRSIMEVVVNPMVEALGSAGDTLSNAATEAVEVVTSSFSGPGEGEEVKEGLEEKDIDEGEVPEAEKQPDEDEKEGYDDPNSDILINLEASSPDETALTSFAAVVGFELYSRNEGRVRLRVRDFGEQGTDGDGQGKAGEDRPKPPSKEKKADQEQAKVDEDAGDASPHSGGEGGKRGHVDYRRHFEDFDEVLLIDYNSKRKRMTIVLRPYDASGQLMDVVKIYSKGADTSIASLLADDDPYWDDSIQPALADYGGESLRTLVCAYSEKEATFYDAFRDKMNDALKSQGKDEKGHVDGACSERCRVCAVENEIEDAADLVSLGCTGIEDKLQEGVPAALQQLLDAGMKVWMLTGDTVSTAVNIAIACNLCDSEMENDGRLFVFDKDMDSADKIRAAIDEAMKKIEERTKGDRGKEAVAEGEGPLFGLALHGDVWKKMQRSKKRKRKDPAGGGSGDAKKGNTGEARREDNGEKADDDGKSDGESGSAQPSKNPSPDLFRQKMGKRKSRSNLLASPNGAQHNGDQQRERSRTPRAQRDVRDASQVKSKDAQRESRGQAGADGSLSQSSSSSSIASSSASSSSSSSSSDQTLLDRFFALCQLCQSVIACRLEPKEKADIVDEMRERTGKTCLAIGDGNNDTLAIKHADIGVGIAGVEGTSAVSSSDFALSQFRFLPTLLLVHGRLNHRRISVMINYIFYKTAFVVWALFFYGIYSQFSGQVFILDWAFQLHNVVYTALPILVFAIFDYDLSRSTLQQHPEVYKLTRYSTEQQSFFRAFLARHPSSLFFSYWDFFEWILISLVHASLCFFFCIFAFNAPASPDPSGQEYGLFEQGLLIYTAIIFTTNLMLLFMFASWTWLHHASVWGSLLLYSAAMAMFSSSTVFDIAGGSLYWVWFRLCSLASFYLTVGLSVGSCLMVTMLWTQAKRWLWAKEETAWMERQQMDRLKASKRSRDQDEDGRADDDYRAYEDADDDSDSDDDAAAAESMRRRSAKRGAEEVKEESKEEVKDEDKEQEPQRYTGSLFSYTPGIRSLRNVFAAVDE